MASQAISLTYCIILIRLFSYLIISSSYKTRLINLVLYSPPQYRHRCHTLLRCPASLLLMYWVKLLSSELLLLSIRLSFWLHDPFPLLHAAAEYSSSSSDSKNYHMFRPVRDRYVLFSPLLVPHN